ncbi:hypothetical protein IFT84_01265 [Rhizobium sp. CFBP 8762]|uniref:hypothetical protein n=1 Tax=Rhizobium sp. CFBP 8762 TaxID=2775279 RepID=UPI00177EB6D3|nr:hypothetical protein [Rhizobium sp. CFBP 8762]MBD8553145.1 hypothetical protein [Rhizobium sp. CFBP 8762]
MIARFRPIHSTFETLRQAGSPFRTPQGVNTCACITNEQLTANGFARVVGAGQSYSDFMQR